MRVLPCAGSLPLQRLVEHLDGRTTCALYPLLPDGTIYTAVIDIDVAPDVDDRDEAMMYARSFALECTTVAAQHGIAVALEESGGKGYHVWLLFAEALPAETGRQLARLLVAASSVPREGLQVEIFPRHSEWPGTELGDCIKLPFGVHVGTGRRTFLLDDDGERMTDLEDALDSLTLVSARQVKKVIRTLTRQPITAARRPSSTSPDGKVQRLVAQCTVIRALVQRARATGHLRHTHRLILLYTLGRLGAAGAAALHAALASCQNYAHPRTQRYLDTLDATCSPLTCRRVREWLEEDVRDADLCACGTERHMPLDGLLPPAPDDKPPKRQPRAKPPASAESLEAWDAVRQDLFGPDETDAVGEA